MLSVACKTAAAVALPQRFARPISTSFVHYRAHRLWISTHQSWMWLLGRAKRGLVVAPSHSELASSLTVISGGRKLRVCWGDGRGSSYHAVWLRHNCQCRRCILNTNQRLIRKEDLDGDIRITSSQASAGGLRSAVVDKYGPRFMLRVCILIITGAKSN